MQDIMKYKKDNVTWYKSIIYSYQNPKPACDYCKQSMDETDKIFVLGFKVWHWRCHEIFFKERYKQEFDWLIKQAKKKEGEDDVV